MNKNTEALEMTAVTEVPSSADSFDDNTNGTALSAGSIGLSEDGEIVFPEGGFGDFDDFQPSAETTTVDPSAEEAATAFYTPEEMADAFQGGHIDEAKIRPEALPYYKEIMARVETNQQQRPAQPQQPAQSPLSLQGEITIATQNGPVTLRQPVPPQITDFKAFMEGAKQVACARLLGIKPEDFDDMDPEHAEARRIAGDQIRAAAGQQYVQDVQRFNMARSIVAERDRRVGELHGLQRELVKELPGIDSIESSYYDKWRSSLTVAEAKKVDEAISRGDLKTLRSVIKQVYSDYQKAKGTSVPAPAAAAKNTPPAASPNKPAVKTEAPPKVEGVSGTTKGAEEAGRVDAGELGSMDIADQADWLVKNGFVK